MGLNTFFAVAGVFVLRSRGMVSSDGYRTWGYPVTPLIFLSLMAWTLTYILINRPQEAVAGLLIVSVGAALYWATERANH